MHYGTLLSMQERQVKRRIPTAKRKRNQIAVRLTDAEMEGLDAIAEREGLPVAYFVREGIQLVIKRHSRKS